MALDKAFINESGIPVIYHRVGQITFNNGRLTCFLESYVSKDYREKNLPVETRSFMFDVTTEEEESCGIRQLCYNKIKSIEFWADAEDC